MSLGKKINVLIFGSGAREHAIAESVLRSPLLGKLYLAEACLSKSATVIEFDNYEDLALKCKEKFVDIAIISQSLNFISLIFTLFI